MILDLPGMGTKAFGISGMLPNKDYNIFMTCDGGESNSFSVTVGSDGILAFNANIDCVIKATLKN